MERATDVSSGFRKMTAEEIEEYKSYFGADTLGILKSNVSLIQCTFGWNCYQIGRVDVSDSDSPNIEISYNKMEKQLHIKCLVKSEDGKTKGLDIKINCHLSLKEKQQFRGQLMTALF